MTMSTISSFSFSTASMTSQEGHRAHASSGKIEAKPAPDGANFGGSSEEITLKKLSSFVLAPFSSLKISDSQSSIASSSELTPFLDSSSSSSSSSSPVSVRRQRTHRPTNLIVLPYSHKDTAAFISQTPLTVRRWTDNEPTPRTGNVLTLTPKELFSSPLATNNSESNMEKDSKSNGPFMDAL